MSRGSAEVLRMYTRPRDHTEQTGGIPFSAKISFAHVWVRNCPRGMRREWSLLRTLM
jgi:hypothetical protein